ncbi:MAG TPA: agmatinase family protein [Fimbriimonas sp.]|nr:agmatinase family protein [Fimbriimonas sp.]
MNQLHSDPNWPRALHWLEKGSANPQINVVGCPTNVSITPGNCHLAPAAIRQALAKYSLHSYQHETDLGSIPVKDWGDTSTLETVIATGPTVILGGDNGVTLHGVRALAKATGSTIERIGLITLDAHHDLRHLDGGDHNGNPVRRLLEDGLYGTNVVQIGIQSFANSSTYAAVAKDNDIQVITNETCHWLGALRVFQDALDLLAMRVDHIYFDLDLDVMDRAFAPGCPGSRPGGLAPWQVRQIARFAGTHPKVQVMDLVELDPTLDVNDITALTAAACLLEFVAGKSEQ